MRALQFIDHGIFKLHYNQIYQMKTTKDTLLGITVIHKCFIFNLKAFRWQKSKKY
jgi:hypothetical protein